MFQSAWNLAIYAAAGLLLAAGVLLETNITALLALGIFSSLLAQTPSRGRLPIAAAIKRPARK